MDMNNCKIARINIGRPNDNACHVFYKRDGRYSDSYKFKSFPKESNDIDILKDVISGWKNWEDKEMMKASSDA